MAKPRSHSIGRSFAVMRSWLVRVVEEVIAPGKTHSSPAAGRDLIERHILVDANVTR